MLLEGCPRAFSPWHFQAALRAGAPDPGAPEQGVPQDLDPAPSLSVVWSNVPGISALSSFVSLSVVPSLSLCLEKVMILASSLNESLSGTEF